MLGARHLNHGWPRLASALLEGELLGLALAARQQRRDLGTTASAAAASAAAATAAAFPRRCRSAVGPRGGERWGRARGASSSRRPPGPEAGLTPLAPLARFRAHAGSIAAENGCKKLVRPDWDLDRWRRDGLHEQPWPTALPQAVGCPRLHVAEARDKLDISRPAVLTGTLDEWPAPGAARWSVDELLPHLGQQWFVVGVTSADEAAAAAAEAERKDSGTVVERRVDAQGMPTGYGSDSGGYSADDVPIWMTLEEYLSYSSRQSDDCPLYIFDDMFLDSDVGRPLAASFRAPSCFDQDFMSALSGERPPHRWLLIGAGRAGTVLHIDPLETSAWNTLVSGHKRWVLFPPSAEGRQLMPGGCGSGEHLQALEELSDLGDSASHWLHKCYPHIDASVGECIDFVQAPGETVYVPSGWWHNVVNLDFTVAVTENFVGEPNLRSSFAAMSATDPETAERWRLGMQARPELRRFAELMVDDEAQ